MFKTPFRFLWALISSLVLLASAQAQVAQSPLLTRSSNVAPNLVLMFDDSLSMDNDYMYQFGTTTGVSGYAAMDSTRQPFSPDLNQMYYDPRETFALRVNADGTNMPAGTAANSITFKMYFYTSATWPYTSASVGAAASYGNPYSPPTTTLAITTGTVTYPQLASSATTAYPKFKNRTDCAAATFCTWAEERQNYANWKLYHSTRAELARTGFGVALKNVQPNFRLGWGTLSNTSSLDAGVSTFNTATKNSFYDWLYGSNTAPQLAGTPNRQAIDNVGKYYSRTDSDGPWGTTPRAESKNFTTPSSISSTEALGKHASCRRSNVLLVTDGYWNGNSGSVGNQDGTDGAIIPNHLPGGISIKYKAQAPYSDGESDTLADTAMKYWKIDLHPGQNNNKVPVIDASVDPAYWQHMTFYGIGLGVYGKLTQNTTTLAQLSVKTGATVTWPTGTLSDKPEAIDDMWHAAINTGGKFLNAGSATGLSSAINEMLASVTRTPSSQSGVAISTGSLTDGTRKFIPRYETGSWTGNVIARNLNKDTGTEISTAWQVVGQSTTGGTTVTFSGIPNFATRTIVVGSGTSTINFTNTLAITSQFPAGTANLGALVNYLRGDQSNEGDKGLQYRTRETLLGDIVNSSPAFVKASVDLKYENLPVAATEGTTYRAHVAAKAARSEGAVYVGANDGMLHVFREGVGATAVDGGKETFAYIPNAVLSKLPELASKAYDHKYYVDGPNVETDAFVGGSWKNLVVGTTGAGAKAVYALNVPAADPKSPSLLWEISSTSPGFASLGHVLSDVQTGRTPSGHWVAMFGNGYDSTGGTASLFVVNLATGALLKQITVDSSVGSNGLGALRLVRDANRQIVGAYAGDLKGKMWKFDLSGTTLADWRIGLNGQPLLDVGVNQPITAAPAIIPHPTTTGFVVSFATGKFFETTDVDTTKTQAVYGVLDNIPFGSPTQAMTAVGMSNLVVQTISSAGTQTRTVTNTTDLTQSTTSVGFFSVSTNPVTYTASVRGWRIDLPNTGQRNVYPVEKLANRYLVVDTISPANVGSDACVQGSNGAGWLYFIDGVTGSGPGSPVIDVNGDGKIDGQDSASVDTNGDGVIDSKDGVPSGLTTTADGRNLVVINESATSRRTNGSGVVDPLDLGNTADGDAGDGGGEQTTYCIFGGGTGDCTAARLTCLQINKENPQKCIKPIPIIGGVKSREWRQLFMR
jgi:type IV pilus assembly protein PilY1